PHIQFDISWNDVGERYVNNIDLMDGLTKFRVDHPDAVIFGTDTVKPVRPQQYLQAFTTLLPYFMRVAHHAGGHIGSPTAAHDQLWTLLRGNFDATMAAAANDVKNWTVAELRSQGKNAEADKLNTEHNILSSGQTTFNRLAREEFDQILQAWEA